MDRDGSVHRPARSLSRPEPLGRIVLLTLGVLAVASCEHAVPDRAAQPTRGTTLPAVGAGHSGPASDAIGRIAAQASTVTTRIPPQAAWTVVALSDGRTIRSAHPDLLDIPVPPGSLMKVVAVAAALEAGLIDEDTSIACARRLSVGTRVLDCVHPEVGHPLVAAEALAHSCNWFAAEVARRLSSGQLAGAAQALGLPPVGRVDDQVLAGLGLDEYRVPPRAWIGALARLAPSRDASGPFRSTTRDVLRAGLRGAAEYGTAAALGARWHALAKTGTAPMASGGVAGLAVAITPADAPGFGVVVVAPGAGGRDAASIAGEILAAEVTTPDALPSLRVGVATPRGYAVRRVALENYVAEVVQGEAPADAPAAMLHALAIVGRTFGLASRGRHADEGFDVCDLTHCQALRPARDTAIAAARATAGRVLSWQGRLADLFYTASCGGKSESAALVWPRRAGSWPAYLVSRPDPAATAAAEVTWEAELDGAQLTAVLRGAGLRGDRFQSLSISVRTPSGRARTLVADGFVPPTVDAEVFRISAGRALGWRHVKSTWFEIQPSARGVRLVGRGFGHGVGLCVRGATVLAGRGASADAVLAAYFPGTTVADAATLSERPGGSKRIAGDPGRGEAGRMPGAMPAIRLVLPIEEEAARERVVRETRHALDTVLARITSSSPAAITVRFHPTVASYQRSTGRPWWTAGTTSGRRIELLPLSVLESQHQLERTLRHELVHVLTEDALASRPRWVREGLAEYLSHPSGLIVGEQAGLDECPDDEAFVSAGSAAALRDLYARAASCVGRQLEQGARWDEIR